MNILLRIDGSNDQEHLFFDPCSLGRGILTNLGLSWEQDFEPLLNEENKLSPNNAQVFLNVLDNIQVPIKTLQELESMGRSVNETNTIELWHQYDENYKQEFVRFLELAINENKYISYNEIS
jgi:hypothetical protein